MKKLLKLTSIFLTIVMCIGLLTSVTVFADDAVAKEDLVIFDTLATGTISGATNYYNKENYTSGNTFGHLNSSSARTFKWWGLNTITNTGYQNFAMITAPDTTVVDVAKLKAYKYLVYDLNFATENVLSMRLETKSTTEMTEKITASNWNEGQWNNAVFVCTIDQTSEKTDGVYFTAIDCYINGKEPISCSTVKPVLLNNSSKLEFRIKFFNESLGDPTDVLYSNRLDIYATDTLPTISMPELNYKTNSQISHLGNKVVQGTKVEELTSDTYTINAFSNDFSAQREATDALQVGDVVAVQDSTNHKITYYDVTDGTYVWKDDMELVTNPKWTASNFTDLGEYTNIGLNEETQTAASVVAGVNPYYQYDTEPGEIWDYFIAEYDVFQKGNTKHALVTHRGHSVSGPAFYLPEAEWCKITVVFDLVNRVANTYVDGVIENPDYVNTTSQVASGADAGYNHFNTLFDLDYNAETYKNNRVRLTFENRNNTTEAKVYLDNVKLWFSNTAPTVAVVEKPEGLTNGLYADDTMLTIGQDLYTVAPKTVAELKGVFTDAHILDANFKETEVEDAAAYVTFKNDAGNIKTYVLDSVSGENTFIKENVSETERNVYACTPKDSLFMRILYTGDTLGPVTVENVGPSKFTKLSATVNSESEDTVKFMLWDKTSIMPLVNVYGFKGTVTE